MTATIWAGKAVCDACDGDPDVKSTLLPARPVIRILRPHRDVRQDASIMVRFDPPKHLRTRAAIIIMPGGNYESVSHSEGQPVAAWLNSLGITAFVLRYRCISEGHYWPAQWEDYVAAFHMILSNAESWDIDKRRIGVMGFSAGGHLAATAAVNDNVTTQPNAQILVYPCIDVTKPDSWPWKVEEGFPAPEESPHFHVTTRSPPAFLTVSTDDTICTAKENTEPYVDALQAAGVPVTYFKQPMGGHGHGLSGGWTFHCEKWLMDLGWAQRVSQGQTLPQETEVLSC